MHRILWLSFPIKMRSKRPQCAHTRCSCLSEVSQNTQTHVNIYTQAQTDKLAKKNDACKARHTSMHADTHARTHTHQNLKPSGVSRLISDCSPLSFQPNSPIPFSRLCVWLQLSVSFCARSLPMPDSPLPPLSRWEEGELNAILQHQTWGLSEVDRLAH